jgi:prepilin-type processing-associated H-X9-DG protein
MPVPADRQDAAKNLEALSMALQMCIADHNDMLPDLADMDAVKTALAQYIKHDSVFLDPGTEEPFGVNSTLSNKKPVDVGHMQQIAVFYTEPARRDGPRIVAFLDGHVAAVSESAWQGVKQVSGIR